MRRSNCFLLLAVSLLGGCTDKHITNNYGPVDWRPPVVEWLTQPDAEVRGLVGIDCQVSDSSELARVVLYVDGVADSVTESSRPRFELITDSLLDGVHLLEVRAWDEFDNLGVSPILRINVVNSVAEGARLIWVPDDYARIQDAINAAMDFDTIRVRDGTYYETLNLFGKGIWLESEHGPTRCSINGGGAANVVFVAPNQVAATIRGFTVSAAFIQIFLDDGAQALVTNNMFLAATWEDGFPYDSTYTFILSGSVRGNLVNNLYSGSNTAVQIFSFQGAVENNIFQQSSEFALWNSDRSRNPVLHSYNAFWNNTQDYAGFIAGAGEFNADPLILIQQGRLLNGSPCIDSGNPLIVDLDGTRSDIGPFGGPYGYR